MDLNKYFVKAPLIPAIIQERNTKKVLMMAYMNEESLRKTMETGYTWFYSRSRKELWNKGASSGHVQKVVRITGDCDDDTLLIEVEQTGPACHTGHETCFFQALPLAEPAKNEALEEPCTGTGTTEPDDVLKDLYQVVAERKGSFSEDSYTCYLFQKGLDKILKKCGEECSEVIIAAKNAADGEGTRDAGLAEMKNEICDLLYHLTVLMVNEGVSLDEIYDILRQRSRKIGNLKTFHDTDHNS